MLYQQGKFHVRGGDGHVVTDARASPWLVVVLQAAAKVWVQAATVGLTPRWLMQI